MICHPSEIHDAFARAEVSTATLGAAAREQRVRAAHGKTCSSAKMSPDGTYQIGKQAMGYVVTLRDDFGFIK
jgi:hypothetical protein